MFWTPENVAVQRANLGPFPRPLQHKLALLKIEPAERSGSLLIDDGTREKKGYGSTTGVVIAIGPTAFQNPDLFPSGQTVWEGDVVLFGAYGGQHCKVPGRDGSVLTVVFLNDDEITARWASAAGDDTPAGPEEAANG